MSMTIGVFTNDINTAARIYYAYSARAAELSAISTALGSDTTTHDKTIDAPPVALRVGADKSPFTNKILLKVNQGKAGNLSNSAMATAVTNLGGALPGP
jgi:hypothetical protein